MILTGCKYKNVFFCVDVIFVTCLFIFVAIVYPYAIISFFLLKNCFCFRLSTPQLTIISSTLMVTHSMLCVHGSKEYTLTMGHEQRRITILYDKLQLSWQFSAILHDENWY